LEALKLVKDLKIGTKLIGAFVSILILSTFVGYLGFKGLKDVEERVIKADDVNRLVKGIYKARIQEKNYILRGDPAHASAVESEIRDIRRQIDITQDRLNQAEDRKHIQEVKKIVDRYEAGFLSYVDLEKRKVDALKEMQDKGRQALGKSEAIAKDQILQLNEIQNEDERFLEDRLTKADDANRLLKWIYQANLLRDKLIQKKTNKTIQAWGAVNEDISRLSRDLRSRLLQPGHINLIDQFLHEHAEYIDTFSEYLATGKNELKQVSLKFVIDSEKRVEELRIDQKRQHQEAQKSTRGRANDKLSKARDANKIIVWFMEVRKDEKEFIVTQDPERLEAVNQNIKKIFQLSEDLNTRFKLDRDLLQLATVTDAIKSYKIKFDEFVGLIQAQEEAKKEMLEAARQVEEGNETARQIQKDKMEADIESANFMVLVASTFAIILGLTLAYVISRGISGPISKALSVSEGVASGDTSAIIEVTSNDETGMLLNSMQKMQNSLREVADICAAVAGGDLSRSTEIRGEKDQLGHSVNQMVEQLRFAGQEATKRDWAKTGHAELAEILRNKKDLTLIVESILDFLVKYLDATIGAIYVKNNDGLFWLTGSYALQGGEKKTFQVGEGLVGQVAKRGNEVILKGLAEVKSGYSIQSGIGTIQPETVLVFPLTYEGTVLGVLELGSMHAYSEDQLDFLRNSTEAMAISINSALDEMLLNQLLKETQEKSRTSKVFQDASDPITIEDLDGNIIDINKETERVYKYKRDELIGHPLSDLIPFTHRAEAKALHDKCWEGEIIRNVEGLRLTKDQRIMPVMITMSPLTDEGGKVVALATIAKDMTEQKKAEDEMRRMSKVFMDSADPIIIENLDGIVIDLNNEAIKSYGFSREELIDKPIRTLVPDEYHGQANELLEKCKRGEEVRNIEGVRWTKSKKEIPVMLTFSQLRDENGEIIALATIAKDITQQKKMEGELESERRNLEIKVTERTEELKLAQNEAESANRSKSDFLANMSHEIRTPMNAIIGMSHLALETELSPKQKNYLDKIQVSSKNLLGIINDILDFSKIEAGKLDIETIDFELDEVLKNVGTIVQHKVQDKELEFLFSLESNVPQHLIGDPLRLGQVLTNLVGNSVKFTEKGSIIISVSTDEFEKDEIALRFSVKDTGIGMSEKQADGLFKPFSQADTSTTRKYGGTGLGLSISKRLVEMMGGKIWVESKKNEGSEFLFTATFKLQKSHLEDKFRSRTDLKGLRVLVVDDSPDSLIVMERFMQTFEFKPFSVSNCEEGKKVLEKQNSKGQPIELVIADYHIPDMNGLQFFDSVQNLKSLSKKPRFLIVTGDGRENTISDIESSKIDSYLLKPMNRSDLFDAIIRIMNKQDLRKINKKKEKVSKEKKKTAKSNWKDQNIQLLLVEDNEINQEVAQELLEQAGFSVTIANDGKEGVEAASKWGFDCILMDIQMPVMDGFQATKIIKTDTKNKNTPVIAMTANAMVSDIEDCREAGMDDHIPKPIDPKNLFTILEKWIGNGNSTDKDLDESHSEKKDPLEELVSNLPGINAGPALQRFSGNAKLYASTLEKFSDNNLNIASSIKNALESGDVDTARREAHSVKGVSGLIGADRLFDVSGILEQKIIKNNGERVESYFRDFSEALNLVLTSLERVKKANELDSSASEEIPGDVEIDKEKVKQLLKDVEFHLKDSDAEVMESLEDLKEELKGCGVNAVIVDLEKRVSCYDFEEATDVLDNLAKSLEISLT